MRDNSTIETAAEAENYIYRSYLDAAGYQDYYMKDSEKRNPEYSREIIQEMSKNPCTVVTGSKGKGSVSCMISQILQSRMNVGMMTSPHLADFRERFRVNGEMISEREFVRHTESVRPYFDKATETIPKSKFISPMGIQTAIALSYFNERNTEFNVFECGKGARFDDVNNVRHRFAVINSIFLEHTRELGESLGEIAEDKSHVIVPGLECAYIGMQSKEVLDVIYSRAASLDVPLKIYGRDFSAKNIRYTCEGMRFDVTIENETYTDMTVPLMGEHQARNCALAMSLCKDVLQEFDIEEIKTRLAGIKWPGRMEIVSSRPFLMVDACINSESTSNIKKTLEYLNIDRYNIIMGIPRDKDYIGVAKALSEKASLFILTKSSNPHYVYSKEQQERLKEEGIETLWSDSVSEGLGMAKINGLPTIMIGSTSIISDFVRCRASLSQTLAD